MTAALLASLHRTELADAAADALARAGDDAVPALRDVLQNEDLPVETRREIPGVLLRIGTPAAAEVLVDSLLQGDATVRYRIIASLNTLRRRGEIAIDPALVELLLAAEIAGHYRSYQAMGALPAQVRRTDVLTGVRQSMEHELERIFRLLSLLLPDVDLQDAYVGLRSANEAIRANALEFLDNVLAPSLRQLLLPLLDPHVTVEERIAIADRIVGAPLTSAEQAVDTLLASGDLWLKSSAAQAVGVLRLRALAPHVRRLAVSAEPAVQGAAVAALQRLEHEEAADDAADAGATAPAHMDLGV
jgi:AAA family ATP:ADP antiporter